MFTEIKARKREGKSPLKKVKAAKGEKKKVIKRIKEKKQRQIQ